MIDNLNLKQSKETLDLALKSNPFDFDVCLKLITLAGSDNAKVTELREHAAKYCPTTDDFWLTWIHETKTIAAASGGEEKLAAQAKIFRLYKQAINCVSTADLWVDYLRFINSQCTDSKVPPSVGASQIRRVCEYAVRDLGLHTFEAPKIWSYYRHFERMLLNTLLENTEERVKLEQQVKRIRNLYSRQLPLPLSGRSDLLDSYRLFEAELPEFLQASPEEIKKFEDLYEKGTIEWELRKSYEHDVMSFSNCNGIEDIQKLYDAWIRYINFEKSQMPGQDFAQVYSVYQRACEDLGHIKGDLWLDWGKWVILHMCDFARAAIVFNRATRYMPIEYTLWCMLLTCQGYKKTDQFERIRKTFYQAMQAINIDLRLENIPAICSFASDAFIRQWNFFPKTDDDTLELPSAEGELESNILYQSESSDCNSRPETLCYKSSIISEVKDEALSDNIVETPTSGDITKKFFERIPGTFELPCVYKKHDYAAAIRSVFEYGQSRILATKRPNNHSISSENESLLTDTLKKLWRFWIKVEALTLKNAEMVLCLAKRLVGFTAVSLIGDFEIIETPIKQPVAFFAPDWFTTVESINALVMTKEETAKARLMIDKGLQIIKQSYMVHRLLEQASQIQVLNFNVATDSEIETVHKYQNFPDDPISSIKSLLQQADTNAVRVTLQRLKNERKKRQRYYSESESEAGFSDASSDSISTRLKSSFRNNKKYRAKIDAVSDLDFDQPYQAFQNIEQSVRATWDGHECFDPSLSPPVAPVTSKMSPIRRKNSFSEPSSSGVSDTQLTPPTSAAFFDTGVHTSEPMDVTDNRKRMYSEDASEEVSSYVKVMHADDLEAIPSYIDEEKHVFVETKFTPAKTGKHYLQLTADEAKVKLLGRTEQLSTVFIKNLDDLVNENMIMELFKDCEGLTNVRVVRDFRKRSKGFCYVDFESAELAAAAVDRKKDTELNGRKLKIAISNSTEPIYEPKTVYISNIPIVVLEAPNPELQIKSLIEVTALRNLNRAVKITSVRLQKKNETFTGYGYVDLETTEDTAHVLSIDNSHFKFQDTDVCLNIAPSVPMKQHRWILAPRNKEAKVLDSKRRENEKNTATPQSKILFVKNLSFQTTENSLRTHFETVCVFEALIESLVQIGTIKTVFLCTHKGKSKGFGFVEFTEEKDAFSGLLLNDTLLDGRNIIVSKSYTIPTAPKLIVKSKAKRRLKF